MRPMTLFPPLLLILAACDGGSPHFMGIEPTRVEVEGSVFAVRVKGRLQRLCASIRNMPSAWGPSGRARPVPWNRSAVAPCARCGAIRR